MDIKIKVVVDNGTTSDTIEVVLDKQLIQDCKGICGRDLFDLLTEISLKEIGDILPLSLDKVYHNTSTDMTAQELSKKYLELCSGMPPVFETGES